MDAFHFSLSGGPRFADRNEHLRATLNERVEFTCNPASFPALSNVTWLRDGVIPSVDNFLRTPDDKTIIIEDADYDDQAVYTCLVCNIYRCDSKHFHLKVRSKVVFLVCNCFYLLLY